MNSLEEAQRIKERIEGEIMAKPGVTGIDAGYHPAGDPQEGTPAIRVYVEDRQNAPELPAEVDGIPVVVIQRRFKLH